MSTIPSILQNLTLIFALILHSKNPIRRRSSKNSQTFARTSWLILQHLQGHNDFEYRKRIFRTEKRGSFCNLGTLQQPIKLVPIKPDTWSSAEQRSSCYRQAWGRSAVAWGSGSASSAATGAGSSFPVKEALRRSGAASELQSGPSCW